MHVTQVAGNLDDARHFLAEDEVEGGIHLSGAGSAAGRSRRRLQHAANRERHGRLTRFGQQVDLRTDEGVAEIVARPALADERVVVVDAAVAVAAEPEDGTRVAIDSGEESDG